MVSEKFTVYDAFIIGVVLILVVLSLVYVVSPKLKGEMVQISVSNGEKYQYSLSENIEYEIRSGEYSLLIKISDNKAMIVSSNCKCKICCSHKPISKTGESIICIPSGVAVKIVGFEDIDGIAG